MVFLPVLGTLGRLWGLLIITWAWAEGCTSFCRPGRWRLHLKRAGRPRAFLPGLARPASHLSSPDWLLSAGALTQLTNSGPGAVPSWHHFPRPHWLRRPPITPPLGGWAPPLTAEPERLLPPARLRLARGGTRRPRGCLGRRESKRMAAEPSKSEIQTLFKRLRAIPTNKVRRRAAGRF